MKNPSNYNDYELSRVIFEIRYPYAYEHWDHAGSLWREFSKSYPSIELQNANPERTFFHLNNQYEISVSIDKLNIICFKPKSDLSDFVDVCKTLSNLIFKYLDINELNRIAVRCNYTIEYDSDSEAINALNDLFNCNLKTKNAFGIENPRLSSGFNFKLEDEFKGVAVKYHAIDRRFTITPPPALYSIQRSTEINFHELTVDFDYYVKSKVQVNQIKVDEWIKDSTQAIKNNFNLIVTEFSNE